MRQIRHTLRLHFEAGLSYAQIARALGVAKSTAAKFVSLARAAGVDWAGAEALSDEALEARLFRPPVARQGGTRGCCMTPTPYRVSRPEPCPTHRPRPHA